MPELQRTAYATYFDSGYLPRALTLIESLRQFGDHSEIWILCLDDQSFDYLNSAAVEGVHIYTLQQVEDAEPTLLSLKSQRSRTEYIFTVGPTFLSQVMKNHLKLDEVLIYLDADLYFFDDPKLVLNELGNHSVGIIEHRYPDKLQKKLAKYGRFNVGWVGFRNNVEGNAVLDWWAERCLEWCSDAPQSDGRYADQGYLNSFPSFSGVTILHSPGLNLAPWNTATHQITHDVAGLQIDGRPLVFFHFHGVRETNDWYVTSQLVYGSSASHTLMRKVYAPYLKHLHGTERRIRIALQQTNATPAKRGSGIRGFIFRLQKSALTVLSILTGNAITKRTLES